MAPGTKEMGPRWEPSVWSCKPKITLSTDAKGFKIFNKKFKTFRFYLQTLKFTFLTFINISEIFSDSI